jgi:hypothetical protein
MACVVAAIVGLWVGGFVGLLVFLLFGVGDE